MSRLGGARRLKLGFERWIKLLVGVNVVLIVGLAFTLGLDMWNQPRGHPDQATLPPSISPDLMEMGLAHIPTSNACVLCHDANGYVGVKTVPAVLHPVEGWRRCVTCHTNPELGRLAPGHEGIAEEECLSCHTPATAGAPITQPHAALQDQRCLSCHGDVAHLPSSMASSDEADCVLCHKPTTLPPPSYPHVLEPRLACRSCHQSAEVGGLRIDHALRTDTTCLLCHQINEQGAVAPTP